MITPTSTKRFLIAFVLSFTVLHATNYDVDTTHSNVEFKVKHMMITNVKGHFNAFEGTYEISEGALKSLKGTVNVNTVDTGVEKRDNHLRSADFFDVEKYPVMTFEMTRMQGDTLNGILSIKGISKPIVLTAEVSGEIKDPWGNLRSGVSLEGSINRKDFGLTWNEVLETGGVLVGDEVKMTVELQGIARQE
jgi:polyisoprenoid-binding protein YceI